MQINAHAPAAALPVPTNPPLVFGSKGTTQLARGLRSTLNRSPVQGAALLFELVLLSSTSARMTASFVSLKAGTSDTEHVLMIKPSFNMWDALHESSAQFCLPCFSARALMGLPSVNATRRAQGIFI